MKIRGEGTRHFSVEELTDVARRAGSEERLREMELHLENCQKCKRAAEMWGRVNQVAQRFPAPEPPEVAVRTVKALYAIHGPQKTRPAKSLVAQLLFDSFQMPVQVGVRSAATSPRQLLFGSGDYRVDVRFEPQEDSDKVSLVGQILDTSHPSEPFYPAAVALVRGQKILAHSVTNNLGEFHLECDLAPEFELRIMIPGSAQVSIPLISVTQARSRAISDPVGPARVNDAPQGRKKRTRGKY